MKGQKTGGRTAGTPNKATGEIKEIARSYGPQAIALLWGLATAAESDTAKVAAIKEILDRGFGKPTQTIAGDPDAPLFSIDGLRDLLGAKLDRIADEAPASEPQNVLN